ncbi:MAG: hypothetical protein ACOX3V_09085 [Bacillota bacterium]
MHSTVPETQASTKSSAYAEIAKFYAPLAVTSVLMMVTHSVVSGAVSRTPEPATALAAYAAAYSVGQMFESPCYGMHRMTLTFVRGKTSLAVVQKSALQILAVLVSCLALVAWTPLSRAVFMGFLRLSEPVYRLAVPSLRVFLLWPISSTLRSLFQCPIVLQKKTTWMTVNMGARVGVMLGLAAILPRAWPFGPVGPTILMSGLCTEALMAYVTSRWFVRPIGEDDPGVPPPRQRQVFSFAVPLSLAAGVQTLARPIIAASLSRVADPEIAMSGYQVATSFSYIFAALTYNIYHLVVVFASDSESFAKVRRFAVGLGVAGSACLLLCSIPVVGNWVFGRIIGTPPEISREAIRTLGILTVTPGLAALVEFYGGVLMFSRHAAAVTAGKFVNVLVTSGSVVMLAKFYPAMGGAVGALALVLGSVVEVGMHYTVVKRFPDCRIYLPATRTHAVR